MSEILHKEECYRVLGACFAVYKDKGHSFTEAIYHECLEIELEEQRIPFFSKPQMTLSYRGRTLAHTFQPDFLCFEKIILEIKAVTDLAKEHRSQLLNYLHAADLDLGLLVNFGHHPKIQHERLLHSRQITALRDAAVKQAIL